MLLVKQILLNIIVYILMVDLMLVLYLMDEVKEYIFYR